MTYNPALDDGYVRLLINDVSGDPATELFTDAEISTFIQREGSLKRAAAQALDTIADSEALTSKAITTQDLSTDGAKVADSLRKRAANLRWQAEKDEAEEAWDFTITGPQTGDCRPELTEHHPYGY